LGLQGVRGIVADSKAYSQRTLGLCLEQKIGFGTRVPRTCVIRQEVEAWGQQQALLPVLLEKPGHTSHDAPRCWHGQSVLRPGDVAEADGRSEPADLRFVVVHASALAQQETKAAATAHAKEAERVAAHSKHVTAQQYACAADAEAAIAVYEGRAQGRRGRRPQPWRSHILCYRVEAFTQRIKRTQRGHPTKTEPPQMEQRYRVVVEVAAVERAEDDTGLTVLATTVDSEVCTDAESYKTITINIARWSQGFAGSRTQRPLRQWAGETRADCRISDAHSGRIARLCIDPAPRPALSA
jgi:hypothetical protein